MKKIKIILLLCIGIWLQSFGQNCISPPTCVSNGGLAATGAVSGDMNTFGGPAVTDWFVSNGTPSYGPTNIWMWSFSSNGEGIYTCFNFRKDSTYTVCVDALYAGTNDTGNLLINACNGLVQNFSSAIPTPASTQVISATNVVLTTWNTYTFTFTANNNYSQLWIRPFSTVVPGSQYAVRVDNIHVEQIPSSLAALNISSSGPYLDGVPVLLTVSGGPTGTTYTWSTGQTTDTITIVPTCLRTLSLTVTGHYINCAAPDTFPTCGIATQTETIKIKASDCCSDECYWKVTGNNILAGNNNFGTLTTDDVDVLTSNTYRGMISKDGHWGMGTPVGHRPDAVLQVHGSKADRHIDVTGITPSIKFYQTHTLPPGYPNSGPKIGLCTSAGNFMTTSQVNDFAIENTAKAGILFGTGWNSANNNCNERMNIDAKGQVGINTVATSPFNPTAYLDVNCRNNNPDDGSNGSDVRFRNLEKGKGSIVVIDNTKGYVYNSYIDLPAGGLGNVNSSCFSANFLPKVATAGSPNLICSQVFDNGTNVGVGTLFPSAKLEVVGGATAGINIGTLGRTLFTSAPAAIGSHNLARNNAISIGATGYSIGGTSTTSKIGLYAQTNANSCTGNNVAVYGVVNNSTGAFCNTHFAGYFAGQTLTGGPALVISDSALKTRVTDLTNAMDIINALRPRTYNFDPGVRSGFALSDKKQYGFISQEVERVLPDVVQAVAGPASMNDDGELTESSATYKAMNYDALIAVLVKGMQEQAQRIDALERLITDCCASRSAGRMSGTASSAISEISISDKNTIILNQNVPNPFAESTSITYYIPETYSTAKIIFTNNLGQLIKSLDIKEMGKGQLNVFADDLSSGQYTYSLIVDGKTIDTKKMMKQ